MIHAAIVDDLSQDAQQLFTLLTEYGTANNLAIIVDCFSSGEAFLDSTQPGKYALVFLDILMKKLNGLETAKRFRFLDSNALLVFVTTESGYAVEGYDMEANGFLVKTLSPDVQAFDRLMDRLTAKLSNTLFLDLTDTELELRIPVDMLQYIDVSDHRLYIHTMEKRYSLRMSLESSRNACLRTDIFSVSSGHPGQSGLGILSGKGSCHLKKRRRPASEPPELSLLCHRAIHLELPQAPGTVPVKTKK